MKSFLILASLAVVVANGSAAIVSYNYDAAGRLTGATYNGATRLAYQYDRNGSLLARRVGPDVIPALAATYTGISGADTANVGSNGTVILKLIAAGGFSGTLTLNGKKVTFRGIFNPDGTADPIVLPGGLTLTLQLDVTDGTETITGLLDNNGNDTDIRLARAAFHPKTNPLPTGWIGKFSALLLGSTVDPALIPEGDGYATGTINTKGGVRAAVRLADNTGFTQSATLTGPAATWFFYAGLYKKQGFLHGIIRFDEQTSDSDFGGQLSWLKPNTPTALHPGNFDTSITLIGSKYTAPASGRMVLPLPDAAGNAQLSMIGTALPGGTVLQSLTLTPRNQWQVVAPVNVTNLKLKTAPGTGLTTGSLKDGVPTFKFGGVVFQKQSLISGHVIGSTQSGPMEITPE